MLSKQKKNGEKIDFVAESFNEIALRYRCVCVVWTGNIFLLELCLHSHRCSQWPKRLAVVSVPIVDFFNMYIILIWMTHILFGLKMNLNNNNENFLKINLKNIRRAFSSHLKRLIHSKVILPNRALAPISGTLKIQHNKCKKLLNSNRIEMHRRFYRLPWAMTMIRLH